jgi:hypothetical protein
VTAHLPHTHTHTHTHTHKTPHKTMVFYILLFMFLASVSADKRFWTEWQQAAHKCNLPLISSCMQSWLVLLPDIFKLCVSYLYTVILSYMLLTRHTPIWFSQYLHPRPSFLLWTSKASNICVFLHCIYISTKYKTCCVDLTQTCPTHLQVHLVNHSNDDKQMVMQEHVFLRNTADTLKMARKS